MLSLDKSVIGLGLVAALSGCADNTQKESDKNYLITMRKVEGQVAIITTKGGEIVCSKGLDKIPRVPQITRKEEPIQLKEGVEFNGAGFKVRKSLDGRYTIILSQLPEGDGGGEVARIINKGGNGTKVITPEDGEGICGN